jgi:protein-disulfide isomerase
MLRLPRLSDVALARLHLATAWIALFGLFVSTYLLITYVSGGPIVCGIVHGCDVVRASSWANVFGVIPRPLLGIVFYVAVYFLIVARTAFVPADRQKFVARLQQLLAAIGFIESGILFFIQWIDLKAFCFWCLLSAVAAVGIAVAAIFERPWDGPHPGMKRQLGILFTSLLGAIVLGSIGLWALLRPASAEAPAPSVSNGALSQPVDSETMKLILPEGTAKEGAASSTVTVVEFLDLECPACKQFHPTMKAIRDAYKDRVTFAVRMFPLVELHPHAKGAAIGFVCAERQGAGIRFVDWSLPRQNKLERADLVGYAKELRLDAKAFEACLDEPAAAQAVVAERKAGEALGVASTPTLFINDVMMRGIPDEKTFKGLLDEALAARR